MMKRIIKNLFNICERVFPFFFTLHTRPKQARSTSMWSDSVKGLPKMAIVIQGGLLLKEQFTLETVKLYRILFPDVKIIVSTWVDEDTDTVVDIEAVGAIVLQHEKPAEFGQQNINLQLVSSLAGVVKAKDIGVEYVLKTRTDQRMYAPNAMEFLWSIVKAFPLKETTQQKERIVGVSMNSFKYRQYGISDMNMFGSVEDMERYWSAPHDALGDDTTGPKSVPVHLPEVYLVANFLKTIGRDLTWNLEDSWNAIADHFAIVDKESIDLYWYKYARMREYKYPQYKGMANNYELSFREWLNVYMQKGKHSVPEEGRVAKVIA